MGPRTALSVAALAAALLTASAVGVAAAARLPGDPQRGKALFVRAGLFCSSCHTLKAVHSRARTGPNLDKVKPSYARVVAVVTNGLKPTPRWPTGMPGYSGQHAMLTKSRIQDLAAFVYTATH